MSARKKIRERLLRIVGECERGQGVSERELEQRATITGNAMAVRRVLRDLLEEEKLIRLSNGNVDYSPDPEKDAWLEDFISAWHRSEEPESGSSHRRQ